MNQSNRQPYFDFLRGIAIIMVVGIHTIKNTTPSFETMEDVCIILLRSILNCAVPLFLAISGFFIARKNFSSINEHMQYLRKQIPKIYIPCLIFSIPYLFISLFIKDSGLFKSFITFFGCGFSVYYFIALIIQYYILLPILIKFNQKEGLIISFIISLISMLSVTYIMNVLKITLPLIIYAGPFPLWILFFFMGVFISNKRRDYSIIFPIIIISIGLITQIIEYAYWYNKGTSVLGIKFSSFIFSAGVIWLLFCKKIENKYAKNKIMKGINWIGEISFGIYLLHCHIISIINKIIPNSSWIITWTVVLSMTILIIYIVKSLIPNFSIKYLGFR